MLRFVGKGQVKDGNDADSTDEDRYKASPGNYCSNTIIQRKAWAKLEVFGTDECSGRAGAPAVDGPNEY